MFQLYEGLWASAYRVNLSISIVAVISCPYFMLWYYKTMELRNYHMQVCVC